MTKEEKRKQKELAKEMKRINSSLSYLSDSAKREFGILAVQTMENVYFCGNDVYRKIYLLEPAILGKKRVAFIKAITDRFHNRIRFTSCLKNTGGKLNVYTIVTVTYHAPSFYEVRGVIEKLETQLQNEICRYLNITFTPCSVESALSYIHYNVTGEMKTISLDRILQKMHSEKLLGEVTNLGSGCFTCNERYGASFIGKLYPEKIIGLEQFYQENEGMFFTVVDFQGFDDEEHQLYELQLKGRYGLQVDTEKAQFINMTYMATVIERSEEDRNRVLKDFVHYLDQKQVHVMPGVGREDEIYQSSCSFGLMDFRSMQIVSNEIIGGLIL